VTRPAEEESDRSGEAGSAPVDFVLVGALVTLMFMAVLQLGIDFYVRNVLTACVADGARYAANSDVADPSAGAEQANEEIARSLGASYATAYAPSEQDSVDGATVVTVDAAARLPLLAWFLPVGPTVHVTGHALLEPR
jgi:Flp pilus assembly protein TadG